MKLWHKNSKTASWETIYYNAASELLAQVSDLTLGIPAVYQKPDGQLMAVYTHDFSAIPLGKIKMSEKHEFLGLGFATGIPNDWKRVEEQVDA